ncbi:unnamed protein product [Adineta steineri]|uniref:NAD(P)(+)--arginine ADP-ribosyltransferase n=1 Tax=Adineta steineri TaxID=433720 RepID=A0A814I465_9BILA|nr:unnamed protein product [Adineta steineri]CAF1112505.1 unnamed protein product [Adineta steineri]
MGICNEKPKQNTQNLHSDCLIPFEDYEKIPNVSLELAIEPLISILPSIQTYVHLVKQKCINPADGLTQDQSASIMLCTIKWQPFDQCLSVVLNTILRSNDREKLKPWYLYLKLLLGALNCLPSTDRIIYRGIKLDIREQYSKNKTITWLDFALCTTSLDLLQSDKYLGKKDQRTIFTIECNSSKDITKHSYYSTTDMFMLLPATQFQIVQCVKQKNKLSWIQLKEIQSPYARLQSKPVSSELSCDLPYVDSTIPYIILTNEANQSSTINDPNHNPKLEQLIAKYPLNSSIHLRFQQLTDCDMKIIVEKAVIEKQCTELWLSNAQITSQGALILSNGLYNNKTLTKLYLNDNCINDSGVYALTRVLSRNNSTLKELYLARNNITTKGAQYLAEMLITNRTITTLCLFGNHIDDNGIKYLTYILTYYNIHLEGLYLSGNNDMTDISIDYFIQMFKQNCALKKLHLFNCNLSDKGKTKLRKEIQIKKYNFLLHM